MFCAVYDFKVKPGQEEHFIAGWHLFTEEIVLDCQSLGARLHRSEDGSFVAYAQWPDKDVWQCGEKFIHSYLSHTHFKECLDGVETLLKMTVVDDLLIETDLPTIMVDSSAPLL